MQFVACSYCGFAIPRVHPRRCPCRAVAYCNELCQQRDWPQHRSACPFHGWKAAVRRALEAAPEEMERKIMDFIVKRLV